MRFALIVALGTGLLAGDRRKRRNAQTLADVRQET